MKILTLSGSTREESSNARLLQSMSVLFDTIEWVHSDLHGQLPLFEADRDRNPLPDVVKKWRSQVGEADAVIICTPEYLHNLPAVLKNAMEWLTTSGELSGKKVLAITLTPHEPRGQKAMQSLLWTLNALDARVVASLPLYQNEISYTSTNEVSGQGRLMLEEALKLFD